MHTVSQNRQPTQITTPQSSACTVSQPLNSPVTPPVSVQLIQPHLSSGADAVLPIVPKRIIRLKQVLELIGLSRSTIYDRMDQKSPRYDATFPKQIKLSGATSRSSAVGWREADILAWISQCQQSG